MTTADERSAKAFIALAVLALVPIFIPDLIGVRHDRIVQYHRPDLEAGRILDI